VTLDRNPEKWTPGFQKSAAVEKLEPRSDSKKRMRL